MLTATTKAEQGAVTLVFEGDNTIESLGAIRSVLLDTLGECDEVNLRFAEGAVVDAALFQLLCAAHRSFTRSEKRLRLDKDMPDSIREQIRALGFQRKAGCSYDKLKNCLWKM